MALEDYSAEEQQFITLFAAVLNKAPTPDLIAEASTYLEAGLSQGDLLQVLFDHPAVPYAGFKEAATTNEFLTALVSNLASGSGIAASVQAQWVTALAADYAVYSAAGYTKGEFAVALVELLQTLDLPAGSDLAKLAANIDAKGVAAGDAYEAGDTYTNWNALETPSVDPQPNPGETVMIGMGDNAGEYVYEGGTGDDMFRAVILDNQNTFVSGLTIDGGAGYDTLYAEIGNSQNFSITPWLTDVEKVQIRVQAVQNDQADNNTGGAQLLDTAAQLIETLIKTFALPSTPDEGPLVPVTEIDAIEAILSAYLLANFRGTQVDAQESSGVLHWESKNSRSDLLIEDVRILDNQITKDITIAFVDSDPGNVDFAVYIDQQSLRKAGATEDGATLVLEILDTRAAVAGEAPLKNNPFDGFGIQIDGGEVIVVRSAAIDAAQTYPELLAAIQAAVAADARLANFEVTLGEQFTAVDTDTGIPVTGTQIVLTNKGEGTVTGAGWVTADGIVPPSTGLHLVQEDTQPIPEDALITSTVILDNVGRGSTGGDLVIGGLSVGDTSPSKGVEQFDITVYQSSKLQTIASTNNTLEVVNLQNDGNTYTDWVDGLPVVRYGNLTVLGSIDSLGSAVFDFDKFGNAHKFTNLVTAGDLPLPGHAVEELLGFGFTDVREINAADFGGSAFKGDIDVSLILTDRVVEKYLDRTDAADDLAADDNVEFSYAFGDGNDRFAIAIDDANLVRAGATTHEDFSLVIDGGKGNDIIKAVIGSAGSTSGGEEGLSSWYLNSKLNAALEIYGGEGDDEVHTIGSGDWFVDLGAGNDTYYADNSGEKAIWVFNAKKAIIDPFADNVYDIESDANDSYAFYGVTLTVSYTVNHNGDDDTYTTKVPVKVPSSAYGSSDLQVNQAIKAAINSDPVLSKLLLAEDGPANTLVVSSLIDGQTSTGFGLLDGDLSVSLQAPTAASLSVTDISGYANAHGVTNSAAAVVAAIQAQIAAFDTKGDYEAEVADSPSGIDGFNGSYSSDTADNTVIGGLGDDVIVLGTGVLSNDTVKYVGLGNGYDTIVNFVVGDGTTDEVTFEQEVPASQETFKLTFGDLTVPTGAVGTVELEFGAGTLTVPLNNTGAVDGSLIPGKDVAFAFINAANGTATPGVVTDSNGVTWEVTWVEGTNEVTFVSVNSENVENFVAADEIAYTPAAAPDTVTGSATVSNYVQGVDGYVEGESLVITLDLNGTAVATAGVFEFDGATINYAVGDGPIALTDKLAAASYTNFTAEDNNDGTITFTAKVPGAYTAQEIQDLADQITADNPTLDADGIVESTTVDNPGVDQEGQVELVTVTIPGVSGIDYLDFSSYAGVDHVVVDGVVLVGGAAPTAVGDAWVSLTERATDAGVYDIALHTITSATVTAVEVIGVADFGNTKDFSAENFIV